MTLVIWGPPELGAEGQFKVALSDMGVPGLGVLLGLAICRPHDSHFRDPGDRGGEGVIIGSGCHAVLAGGRLPAGNLARREKTPHTACCY